ncbi:MAG: hypothetical protein RJA34_1711 [Pseudomonadota bacterium]
MASRVAAQQNWDLDRLLAAAWDSHPHVMAKRAAWEAAQGDLAGAKWQRYPTPTLESGVGSDGKNTSVLRVDQPIWNAGRIDAGVDGAVRRTNVAEAEIAEARHELGLKVIAAWAEATRQQSRAIYAQEAVSEHQKLHQMIERRVLQEVSPVVDRNFAQSRLLQVINDLSVVKQALRNALNQLSQLAGQPVTHVLGSVPGDPITLQSMLSLALNYSPTLHRLTEEEAAADADLASRRASVWPQVILRVEKQMGVLADQRAMLVLTAQPGAGLSAAAGIDAAVARREAIRMGREAAVRDIQEQVAMDVDDMNAARERHANAGLSKSMASEVSESYARQYVAGRKTWIDVLNAVKETTQANLAVADAEAQSMAAFQRIQLRTGQWTNILNAPIAVSTRP